MSVKLPNGAIVSIASERGEAINFTAITNANPAVATATGHGLSKGDIVSVTSGWNRINDKVVRVGEVTDDTFELDGIDTTDTSAYPAGSGTGSVKKVSEWTQIQQITNVETSGGEMQFATYSFLENDYESQIPTQSSAQSLTLTIADDASLPGYKVLKEASEKRVAVPIRITLPDGSVILYNGYVSFNETPTMTKGEIMAVSATISLLTRPVRY